MYHPRDRVPMVGAGRTHEDSATSRGDDICVHRRPGDGRDGVDPVRQGYQTTGPARRHETARRDGLQAGTMLTGDRIGGALRAHRGVALPATAGTRTPARGRNGERRSAASSCRPPAWPPGRLDRPVAAAWAAFVASVPSRADDASPMTRQMAGRASWKNGQGCRPHDETGGPAWRRRGRLVAPRAGRRRPVRSRPALLAPGIEADTASGQSKTGDNERCRDAASP
jgi:hypothetical protein